MKIIEDELSFDELMEAIFGVTSEEQRDLFTMLREYSFAHCVAADLDFGRSIARVFDKAFGARKEQLYHHQRQKNQNFLFGHERTFGLTVQLLQSLGDVLKQRLFRLNTSKLAKIKCSRGAICWIYFSKTHPSITARRGITKKMVACYFCRIGG